MACGVAEARRLHGADLQRAAQLVDDQRGQGLASTSSR